MHTLEYRLRFLMDSHTLKVVEIEDCTNPKKMLEFNNIYCDAKKVQAFCQSIEEVSKIPMLAVPYNKKALKHTVYFCEVAVGRSLFVTNSYSEAVSVPSGFDSLIVNDDNTSGYLTEKDINIKKCHYVIKDKKRILPLYKVTFEYDEEFELRSRGKNICHRCLEEESVVFCPSERASFCKSCDLLVHSDTFLQRHERKYFDAVGQKKFICCDRHPSKIIEYFCETCLDLICTECKITGNHSGKEFVDHKITPYLEACNKITTMISQGEDTIKTYIESVESQTYDLKESVDGFRSNISNIKKNIEKEYKNLLLQIDNIESCQRSSVNAEYLDRLTRRAFLNDMILYPSNLDPADRLAAFKNIQEQRANEKTPEFPKTEIIKAELKGKATITTSKVEDKKSVANPSFDRSVNWKIVTMNMNEEVSQ